jgi:hypothetical protein
VAGYRDRKVVLTRVAAGVLLLAGVTAAAQNPSRPAVHNTSGLFALSPIYTVAPDGTVGELKSGDLGALKTRNEAFDGSRQTLLLSGAQHQEVAVQIVIPLAGKKYAARLISLEGVPADRVTFSTFAWSRKIPDVTLPLDGSVGGLRTFDVPLDVAGLPRVNNRWGLLLMEVWIPKDAAPGLHRGTVAVLQDGKELARLGVDLTVHPLRLPDRPTFRMDYLSYASPLRRLGLDVQLGNGATGDVKVPPAALAAEQQAHALALDNRGYLGVLPYASQRGNPFYAYPVTGTGRNATITSFDGFDARFGPLLDGKVGKYRTAPPIFGLAFNLNYPYRAQTDPAAQFDWRPFKNTIPDGPGQAPALRDLEDTWRAVGQQTLAHFAQRGWTNTAFEILNNQKPAANNTSPWHLDEPVDAVDYRALRYLFNLARWSFDGAGAKGVQIITRLDIGHWECGRMRTLEGRQTACYKAKDFNRARAAEVLRPVVDRWVVGHVHVHGAPHLVGEYNSDRVMFDEYAGSGIGVTHGGGFAGLAWVARRLGIEGRLVFQAGYLDPNDSTGEGTLYVAKGLSFVGVLASRRIKLWRDAVNDYDLLVLASRSNPKGTAALIDRVTMTGPASDPQYRVRSKTIETYVTNNVEDLLRARRIAAALAGGQTPGPGLALEGSTSRYNAVATPNSAAGLD